MMTAKVMEKDHTNKTMALNNKAKGFFKKLIVSLAINIGIVLVFLLFFTPSEKTDDYVMKSILDGAFGYGLSTHLPYCNIILGVILKFLQNSVPVLPWYEISNYLMIFVSFIVITFIVFNFDNMKKTLFILSPLLIFGGFEGYVKLTFSKTAGIAVACGFFAVLVGLKADDRKKSYIINGSILVFAGSLFRYKIIYLTLPIILGIVVIDTIYYIKELGGVKWKKIIVSLLWFIIPIASIFIIVFGLQKIGYQLYKMDPEWGYFREYNSLKANLQDYGWPDYYENKEAYNALGITEIEYSMWTNRDYGDPDILTNELMSEIIDIKGEPGLERYWINLLDFIKEYPISFIKVSIFGSIVLLVIMLLFAKQMAYKWLIIVFPLSVATLLEYYLFCNGRYAKPHIDIAIWITVAVVWIYYLYDNETILQVKKLIGSLAIIVLFFTIRSDYSYITSSTYDGNNFYLSQDEARYAMDLLSSDKSNLYIMSNNEYYGLMRAYGTFETIPKGKLDNIFILSAFNYPSHRSALYKYGYDNAIKSLTRPNVYYVTSKGAGNASIIKKYLSRHYYFMADYVYVYSIGKVNVYKFYYDYSLLY